MRRLLGIATLSILLTASGGLAADAGAQTSAGVSAVSVPIPPGPTVLHTWTPNVVTVQTGGTVTFTNPTAFAHNVLVGGTTALPLPVGPFVTSFTAPSTPGGVQFICTLHTGMVGAINVVAAPAPTPVPNPVPNPVPAPTPTPTPSAVDVAGPVLANVRTSRRSWKVTLSFRLDEPATVTARLKSASGSRTLKRVTSDLDAGNRTLTITRSFTVGRSYRILLELVDASGNLTKKTVFFIGARRLPEGAWRGDRRAGRFGS
jgi:plastocyanin